MGELEQLQDQQQQHQPAFTATLDSDGLAATQDEVKKKDIEFEKTLFLGLRF